MSQQSGRGADSRNGGSGSSSSSSSFHRHAAGATTQSKGGASSALPVSAGESSVAAARAGGSEVGMTFTAPAVARYTRPPKEDIFSDMPCEIVHRVLTFLDIDAGVNCSMLSPRYTRVFDERICKQHCERIYLDQPQVKVLNPQRFKSSWFKMLRSRPRLKTNGMYYLLSSYIKKPMRDMWTEMEPGSILEVKYYRYFRFMPQGRLIYGLLHQPPHEAIRLFREGGRHKDIFEGTFYVHRGEVYCQVHTHYAIISFKMEIQDGKRGKFCQLALNEHSSLPISDPTGNPIPHRTVYDQLLFHKVPQW